MRSLPLRYRNCLLGMLAAALIAFGLSLPASASSVGAPVISASGSTVAWSGVADADGYNIYLNDSYIDTVESTSYVAGSSGSYYVTAFDKDVAPTGYSIASNRVGVEIGSPENTVDGASPVSGIETPVISTDGSTVSWSAVADADGYNIYIDDTYAATVESTSFIAGSTGSYYVTAFSDDSSPMVYSSASNSVSVAAAASPNLEASQESDTEQEPEANRSANFQGGMPAPPPPQRSSAPDDSGYSQIFRDDFEGTSVSSNFAVPGWMSSPRTGRNSAEACSQQDGILHLSIKTVGNEQLACYLISNAGNYGPGPDSTIKIEYRANFSQVKAEGAWFAGWMYALGTTSSGVNNAEDGQPETGAELDIFEYMPTNRMGFNSAIHDGGSVRSENWTYPGSSGLGYEPTADAYHTYTLEWNKSCAAFSVDGKRFFTETSNISAAENHSIMLTMEAQTGTQWYMWDVGSFADNLKSNPAVGKIDWVSVSKKGSIDPGLCG